MRDVCEFLASRVHFPRVKAARLLGRDCVPAGAFLTIRALLDKEGVDVKGISPSTPLADYTRSHFTNFFGAISQHAPRAIPDVNEGKHPYYSCSFGAVAIGMLTVAFSGGLGSLFENAMPLIALSCIGLFGFLMTSMGLCALAFGRFFVPVPELKFGELRTFRDLSEYIASRIAREPIEPTAAT